MKMKPQNEVDRMKRSKEYRDYLNGKGDLKQVNYNAKKGDEWASLLYGNRLGNYYDQDGQDFEKLRIGYDEEDVVK